MEELFDESSFAMASTGKRVKEDRLRATKVDLEVSVWASPSRTEERREGLGGRVVSVTETSRWRNRG